MKSAVAACAALVALAACGEAQVPGRATVHRGAKHEVLTQLAAALGRSGHKCLFDEDGDLGCISQRPEIPAVIVSLRDGPGGTHLNFLSAFRWKAADPCAEMSKVVNRFNGRAGSYYAVCTPDGLTLQTMLVVPETGLSDHDTQAFLNWWGPTTLELAKRIAGEGKVELAAPGG